MEIDVQRNAGDRQRGAESVGRNRGKYQLAGDYLGHCLSAPGAYSQKHMGRNRRRNPFICGGRSEYLFQLLRGRGNRRRGEDQAVSGDYGTHADAHYLLSSHHFRHRRLAGVYGYPAAGGYAGDADDRIFYL